MKVGYRIMEQQFSSLGCWGVSNTISLVLLEYDYDIDDRATTAFFYDGEYHSKRTTKVHYTTSGRVYIVRYGTRYYFDECIKNA